MDKEIFVKADNFLRKELRKLDNYYDKNIRGTDYRIEHSYRVAYLAKEIAKKEGFDQDIAFLGGLFHDIGYSIDYSNGNPEEHGRDGARIIRPFLESLGLEKDAVEEICYSVSIHVDCKSDFEFKETTLALSVKDADDIDRVDAYRLYEGLHNNNYMNKTIKEQEEFVNNILNHLAYLKSLKRATKTAQEMWDEKINFQIEFYNKLKNQVLNSK